MEKLLKEIYSNKRLYRALSVLDIAITVAFWLGGAYLFVLAALRSITESISLAVAFAVPFLLVSILRYALNMRRPYEVFDFYADPPRKKKGLSFPSRHILSATLISVLYLPYNLVIAVASASLTLLLGALRVLLGYHFPRDITAGLIIGIMGAAFGIFILL
jgi:membrane-associated phospholipid phosphatase